jgi:hydrogenase maturation protease
VNLGQVEKIAEAVLYEGYMLYPYRPSSVKNQRRWNFGVLCPPSYCEQQHGTERDAMQTEVLLRGDSAATVTVKVRFLQIIRRSIGKLRFAVSSLAPDAEPAFDSVERLEVCGRVYQAWQEAVEREIVCDELQVGALASPISFPFEFDAHRAVEPVYGDSGKVVAVIVREWERVSGSVEIAAARLLDDLDDIVKLRVVIRNQTPFASVPERRREDAVPFSLVSAHTILGVQDGEFLSLLEPPLNCESLAAGCQNVGTWPVLVGEQDSRQAMLSSPIILYDYPQIAPESVGSLFDGTEIDEILSLRIMTLTDGEKREMRQSDDRSREILERTENLPEEQFMKLHGVLRGFHPMKEEVQ